MMGTIPRLDYIQSDPIGLHYNYFRDYDPATGRYTQGDPIGLAGGLNAYEYANEPITGFDAFGLFRMRARDFYDGTTKFDFEFEPGCVGGFAKENLLRPVKWLQRAVSAKKLAVGDRFSGSNDAGSAWLTCM